MDDVLINLTTLAVSIFRKWNAQEQHYYPFFADDGVLKEVQRLSFLGHTINEVKDVVPKIFTESEFSVVLATDGNLTPMILTANGGSRMSASGVLTGLLTSALVQMYLLKLPNNEATFVRTVLDNFEELRRAARNEKVRAYFVTGIAGVTLSENKHATTPWGILRPAPQVIDSNEFIFYRPKTSCTLIEQKLISVKFDLAREPKHTFDKDELRSPRASLLFPLACTLSSKDTESPAGPVETWLTLLLPFQAGFGYSQPMLAPRMQKAISLDNNIDSLETISKTIDTVHTSNIDVAARRLVSSVAHRTDHSDALIDAVMVWENLFGTKTEVTFRVTAALSKMLESDSSKRQELRKSLAAIYNTRSRIVHGDAIEQSVVSEAAKTAVATAIKALNEFYRRGEKWLSLSSSERADVILLS